MAIGLGDLLVSVVAAFLATLIPGPLVIGWLKRRFRERIASDSRRLDELHAAKQGTPTMGGVLMTAGAIVGIVVCPAESVGWTVRCQAIACFIGFSALGICDDYTKAVHGRKGLTVLQKLTWQLVLAGIVGVWLAWSQGTQSDLGGSSSAPLWLLVSWTMFWVAGGSNAVNLTDGLDGLAAGSVVLSGAALAVVIGVRTERGVVCDTCGSGGDISRVSVVQPPPRSGVYGRRGGLATGCSAGVVYRCSRCGTGNGGVRPGVCGGVGQRGCAGVVVSQDTTTPVAVQSPA